MNKRFQISVGNGNWAVVDTQQKLFMPFIIRNEDSATELCDILNKLDDEKVLDDVSSGAISREKPDWVDWNNWR